jgi:hypothetical protein
MVVLLNIEGNFSCLRAKPAHFSGHLPISPRRIAMQMLYIVASQAGSRKAYIKS